MPNAFSYFESNSKWNCFKLISQFFALKENFIFTIRSSIAFKTTRFNPFFRSSRESPMHFRTYFSVRFPAETRGPIVVSTVDRIIIRMTCSRFSRVWEKPRPALSLLPVSLAPAANNSDRDFRRRRFRLRD